MLVTARRVLAGTITTAALAAGFVGFAPTAAAQPTVYNPVLTPCSDQFRTPINFVDQDRKTFWSPFGTSNIACYDDGMGVASYYQHDPFGNWHAMNELLPGQWFYVIFTSSIPDQARWE